MVYQSVSQHTTILSPPSLASQKKRTTPYPSALLFIFKVDCFSPVSPLQMNAIEVVAED